ncbi:MAG: hypothetical protein P4L92_19040 [Rudaea sp.]|nr:hypothetical protein [Rudaea sp.]
MRALAPDWGCFSQAMLQLPLQSRDDFNPGAGFNANLGLRYTASETFVPQLHSMRASRNAGRDSMPTSKTAARLSSNGVPA